jgi:hypothetical protein
VVSHILVLSDKSEDVSSLEAWKKTYIKSGMSDQDKALAIWKTVIRYRHQSDPPNEFLGSESNVHDPLKTIHVYGYGMCCCASSDVDGLARYLGMKAECRGIGHMISEVWYDNAWHMVDGSLQQYYTKPDGKIASAEEIRLAVTQWLDQHPELRDAAGKADQGKLDAFKRNGRWKKEGPVLLATCPYFDENGDGPGTHSWTSTMWYYDRKDIPGYETFPSMGYKLNVQLREGEKLTRNWAMNKQYIGGADAVIASGDRSRLSLQASLGDKAPGRLGSGTLEYDVPLASGAFRKGVLTADNLACTAEDQATPALHLKDASTDGVLVVRMPCSYVYTGGTLAFDAMVGNGGAVVVSFSDTQGAKWTEVANVKASGPQKIDLFMACFRRYDYLLKFEIKGTGTGLEAIRIANPFQCSQAALPTITEGKNTIAFSAGPQEGTITFEGATSYEASRGKQVLITDFQPVLNNIKKDLLRVQGKGDATWTIPTPGDVTRVRMNLGYRARDVNDYYQVLVSFDDGKTYRKVDTLAGPTPGTTRYLVVNDVPAGVRLTKIRLEGKEVNATCLFGVRFDVDYQEPHGGFRPVQIAYTWTEDGQPKSHVYVAKHPEETYTITCGPKTVAGSFTVSLAP